MSKTNIYVLRLEGGRYYVGKSDNVMNRYQQHLNGSGSAWTKKYKPVSLEKIIENVSSFEEDKITKEYMYKYGIDKVRGGSYVEIQLSKFHTDALNMEIRGAKDLCTKCGRSGHFVKDCYAKTDASGLNGASQAPSKKEELFNKQMEAYQRYREQGMPKQGMRKDEEDEEEWGCEYCDRTFTTAFGCGIHEKSCKEKNVRSSYVKQTTTKKNDACYRCGRPGHYSPECYAKTHHKGYTLDSDCEYDEDSD
jgi:predicted GIY-YIG superfamily endonuclease